MSASISSRSSGSVHAPGTVAEPFVFGAPVPLGDEELDALEAIHTAVGLRLAESWSELLRIGCTVTPREVAPVDRQHLDNYEPSAAHHSLIELVPVPGAAVVIIPGGLALLLVDLLLGGSGRNEGATRSLTAIDAELLANFVSASCDALAAGYATCGTTRVHLDVSGLDPEGLDLGERLGSIVLVSFDVLLGEVSAELTIALDRAAAEAMVGGGSAVVDDQSDDDARQFMRDTLREVRVQVVVEFPKVMVRSTDLMRLGVGDVMPLPCSADGLLRLRVGDEPMGTVRAARAGSRLACQVVSSRHVHHDDIDDSAPLDLSEGAA